MARILRGSRADDPIGDQGLIRPRSGEFLATAGTMANPRPVVSNIAGLNVDRPDPIQAFQQTVAARTGGEGVPRPAPTGTSVPRPNIGRDIRAAEMSGRFDESRERVAEQGAEFLAESKFKTQEDKAAFDEARQLQATTEAATAQAAQQKQSQIEAVSKASGVDPALIAAMNPEKLSDFASKLGIANREAEIAEGAATDAFIRDSISKGMDAETAANKIFLEADIQSGQDKQKAAEAIKLKKLELAEEREKAAADRDWDRFKYIADLQIKMAEKTTETTFEKADEDAPSGFAPSAQAEATQKTETTSGGGGGLIKGLKAEAETRGNIKPPAGTQDEDGDGEITQKDVQIRNKKNADLTELNDILLNGWKLPDGSRRKVSPTELKGLKEEQARLGAVKPIGGK